MVLDNAETTVFIGQFMLIMLNHGKHCHQQPKGRLLTHAHSQLQPKPLSPLARHFCCKSPGARFKSPGDNIAMAKSGHLTMAFAFESMSHTATGMQGIGALLTNQ